MHCHAKCFWTGENDFIVFSIDLACSSFIPPTAATLHAVQNSHNTKLKWTFENETASFQSLSNQIKYAASATIGDTGDIISVCARYHEYSSICEKDNETRARESRSRQRHISNVAIEWMMWMEQNTVLLLTILLLPDSIIILYGLDRYLRIQSLENSLIIPAMRFGRVSERARVKNQFQFHCQKNVLYFFLLFFASFSRILRVPISKHVYLIIWIHSTQILNLIVTNFFR